MMRRRSRWGDTHDQLVKRLSPSALSELITQFGGKIIRVPRKVHETREERTARIIQLLDDRTYSEAAEEMGCDPSTIYRNSKATN